MTDRPYTDPRIQKLAEARQRIAHEGINYLPAWGNLTDAEREQSTHEAAVWLRAAVEAGIAPLAARPSDDHDAVFVDDAGFLYGEYRTSPPSDAVIRLVWASEMAESKADLEQRGTEFRLLGWSS
ncbi:hypothetical protein [Streptomyces sp. NPDC059994]|uniref:hypothetical protein n=1 Tax=Streptomyces sp. NPDC059994 TaxID=3347029 RepID=UPI0036CEC535